MSFVTQYLVATSGELLNGLNSGLVAYWNMNEQGGTRDNDSGDANLDATEVGATLSAVPGPGFPVNPLSSGCRITDTPADYLHVNEPSNDALTMDGTDATICGWVNFNFFDASSVIAKRIVSKYTDANNDREFVIDLLANQGSFGPGPHFSLFTSEDGTLTNINRFNSPIASGTVTSGVWYFILMEHDISETRVGLDINNSGIANYNMHDDFINQGQPLRWGRIGNTSSEPLDGSVSQWGFWNRLLTDQEKTLLYNQGSGILFPFNLGSGIGPESQDPADLGGYTEGKTPDGFNQAGIVGAYATVEAFNVGPASIGGYVLTLPVFDSEIYYVGAALSGLFPTDYRLGAYSVGSPNYNEFVEAHARTLAKASDESTVDQRLEVDAIMVLKQRENKDLNAKLIVSDTASSEFLAKLEITEFSTPPTVIITDISVDDGGLCPSGTVTVTASGTLGDGDKFVSSYIDFGEPILPDGSRANNASISGFTGAPPWTATHCYSSSGIYSIIARAQDNKGQVGSDFELLNLASGLEAGVDYPAISISGTPRAGFVPPALQVDFTLETSGSLGVSSPTDSRLYWNMGNRDRSQRKNPTTFYISPGEFIPTARLRYVRPDGNIVWVADTLRIGFNR